MVRKLSTLTVLLVLFSIACGSMNRVLPSEMDAKAMEADVRGKIAEAVPEKTFAVEVDSRRSSSRATSRPWIGER